MIARSPEMEAFVAEAREVRILDAFSRAGGLIGRLRHTGGEYVGPCPSCGGKDRFALNVNKNVFNCRKSEGGDGIKLVQHITGEDFLDACEILTGRERPDSRDENPAEREKRRREAEARRVEQRRRAAEEDERTARQENQFRARELERCLGIWGESMGFAAGAEAGFTARQYLIARGLPVDRIDPAYLRTHQRLGFYVKPDVGPSKAIHHGPAQVALFVTPDNGRWRPIGIHQTWIDPNRAPKFRPELHDPETGEELPTKKMRGTKSGGLIPVIGRVSASRRMVAGEGIETVLGFARFEGVRGDTFYCAAGDLGNLAGRATQESRIRHPTAFRTIKGGGIRKVMVPGFEPDMTSACLPVPDHIRELVLLGDGDSEPVMTRAALKRGCKRHAREGRVVRALFAPAGGDWADVPVAADGELDWHE